MNTRTPTHRVEYFRVIANGRPVHHTPSAFRGRASDARLAEYIKGLEDSTLPGGCNEHLGCTRSGAARIIRQATGETVATNLPGTDRERPNWRVRGREDAARLFGGARARAILAAMAAVRPRPS